MATDTERLIFMLEANTKKFESSLMKAERIADRRMKAMESRAAQMEGRLQASMAQGGKALMNTIGTGAVGVILAKTANGVKGLMDAYTNLTNQTRMYSKTQEEAASSTQMLLDIASDARVKLDAVSQVYGAASRAGQDYNATQGQVIALTRVIAQSASLGGTSAEAISGALVQISQALPAAKVSAEEFNSVIEGTPKLAEAIAKGMEAAGGSVSKLQLLVRSGKVSGSDLTKALLSQIVEVQKELDARVPTIEMSLERLRTKLVQVVGGASTETQASENIAKFIDGIADSAETAADVIAVFVDEASKLVGVVGGVAAVAASFKGLQILLKAFPALMIPLEMTRIAGAAAGMEVAAVGVAGGIRAMTAAAIGFIGTPLGIVLLAAAAAAIYLTAKTAERVRIETEHRQRMDESEQSGRDLENAMIALANATDETRKAAQEAADAARDHATALALERVRALEAARANLVLAQARADADVQRLTSPSTYGEQLAAGIAGPGGAAITIGQSQSNLNAAAAEVARKSAELAEQIKAVDNAINGRSQAVAVTPAPSTGGSGRKKGNGQSARNAAEKREFDAATRELEFRLEIDKLLRRDTQELEKQIEIRKLAVSLNDDKGIPNAEDWAKAREVYSRLSAARASARADQQRITDMELEAQAGQLSGDRARQNAAERFLEIEEETSRVMANTLKSYTEARVIAEENITKLQEARTEGAMKELKYKAEQDRLDQLQASHQEGQAAALEAQIYYNQVLNQLLEDRVANAQELAQAAKDQFEADRRQVRDRAARAREIAREIELLRLRGAERDAVKLERKQSVGERAVVIAQEQGKDVKDPAVQAQAASEIATETAAELEGKLRDAFKSGLSDAIRTGDWDKYLEDKLSKAWENAVDRAGDALWELAKTIFSSFKPNSSSGGGFLSAIASIFSPSVSGKRAAGGPVGAGKSYLVGERGPEIFTAGVSGAIAANKNLVGASRGPVQIIVNAKDALLTSQLREDMMNAVAVGIQLDKGATAKQNSFDRRYSR